MRSLGALFAPAPTPGPERQRKLRLWASQCGSSVSMCKGASAGTRLQPAAQCSAAACACAHMACVHAQGRRRPWLFCHASKGSAWKDQAASSLLCRGAFEAVCCPKLPCSQ